MSFLLGTIKNKLGVLRQFKDMSLSELNFSNNDCNDYEFDELDGDDDCFRDDTTLSHNSKKRMREDEYAEFEEYDVKPKIEQNSDCTDQSSEDLSVDTFLSETNFDAVTDKKVFSESSPSPRARTPESVFVHSLLFSDSEDEANADGEKNMEKVLLELEAMYSEGRDIVVRADGFISTPLHAMKMLANKVPGGIPRITTRYGEECFSRPLTRVEFKCKDFHGVGESFNERMAAQMAALDVLIRALPNTDVKIVPFALYPGWRLSPRVMRDLMLFCKKNGLKWPRYITKSNIEQPEKPVCLVECYIDKQLIASGESDLPPVARKLAALHAIEELTGEKYPLEHVAYGKACITVEELEASGYSVVPNKGKPGLLKKGAQGAARAARRVGTNKLDASQQRVVKQRKMDNLKITIGSEGRTVEFQ